MTIYFISDLHLQDNNSNNAKLFFQFLADFASKAEKIYILGDFFNVWLGDDIELPLAQSIRSEFAKLTQLGVKLYLMRGNRDFLLGDEFIRSMHCTPMDDPIVIALGSERVLLTHGDLLNTADKEYQIFRKIVRNCITKFIFRNLPKTLRYKIAGRIRKDSSSGYQRKLSKDPKVFAISQTAVEKNFLAHKVTTMIHGHIHLPGWHEFSFAQQDCKRIVLGDWDLQAQILAYTDGKFELMTI